MARRRTFGNTWWGQAWTDALEGRASLDPNRLPRGRTYARHGNVLSFDAEPGAIRAKVQGSRATPYVVEVTFRTFTDAEWDRLLDIIVAKAARAAALLDGELTPDLVDDAAAAGVDLLPRAGELDPWCSCPDWADPCKHAAAACYLIADELDVDPFALLLLRGRTRDEVLAAVRNRRRAAAPAPAPERDVLAHKAWSRTLGELPDVPHPRPSASRAPAWAADPPADAPFTADGLAALVDDAAARAWAAASDGVPLGLGLTSDQDLARRAALLFARGDGPAVLARHAGTTPQALARRAAAWQAAGTAGLDVLDEPPWRPDPITMAAARDAVVAAGVPHSRIRVDRNRLISGDTQLRLARDGRWYRFTKRANAWELHSGPTDDPDDLLA